jgi:serine/threonine protein phosphatase PrpC
MDFVKFGCETDIGGSKQNQDHWFNWKNDEKRLCVFGIADGHGTYGKEVANLTSKTILEFIETNSAELETDVIQFLHRCFTLSHENFKCICSEKGITIGGTTLSIVAIVDNKIYVANVGDSPVYLCTKSPVLKQSMIRHEIDFAVSPDMELLREEIGDSADDLCSTLELICNHSVDNLREFDRIRKQHPSTENPGYAELSFFYDKKNSRQDSSSYKQIFTVAPNDETPPVKNLQGEYYKNVSREWGTIVKGNLSGHLAFTRSIGDLYWKDYGVTEHPEIQSFDLRQIPDEEIICIVAASDGISDNWLCENVGKFVMDPSCLNAVVSKPDIGAQQVALSFVRRNARYALGNFGDDRDNATVNLAYFKGNLRFQGHVSCVPEPLCPFDPSSSSSSSSDPSSSSSSSSDPSSVFACVSSSS